MIKASPIPAWQRALVILTSTVVGVVVVAGLYWAQSVVIPIVLAVLLTFILGPIVTALGRRGLGRTPAAVFVVLITALVVGGTLWLFTAQVTSLVGELPKYSANIKEKARSLRRFADNSATQSLERMIVDIGRRTQTAAARRVPPPPTADCGRVVRGRRRAAKSGLALVGPDSVGFAGRPLGGLGLALVLAVFMLLRREDLRNRVIRLLGHGRVTVTTKAVDDAGRRISRYLMAQLVINACVGVVIGCGLKLIGMDYAFLWGFLAGLLRYLPYVGIWLAVAPPLLLSLGMFPGWIQPSLVIALFASVELINSNFIEPRLYGQSIGVSEVALLIVAACWAFLWGPIGLVLSGPLTVCLVVLGKYVPHLKFLDILLGDEPALDSDVSYYQRLLAGDQDEATKLALAEAEKSPDKVCDSLLLPALIRAHHDHNLELLSDAEEQFVLGATAEILEEIVEQQPSKSGSNYAALMGDEIVPRRVKLVCCPARGVADSLALEMLCRGLDPAVWWDFEIGLSDRLLSAEMVEQAAEAMPAVVCIAVLPPGGLTRGRHLCRRLRRQLPQAHIVVGRWGATDEEIQPNREPLREVGADEVDAALRDTITRLDALRPVFLHGETAAQPITTS